MNTSSMASQYNTGGVRPGADDVAFFSFNKSDPLWQRNVTTPSGDVINIDTDDINRSNDLITVGANLFIYSCPVIFVLGLLGNILTMVVVCSRYFQHATLKWTLNALAIADTCSLFFRLLPLWFYFVTRQQMNFDSAGMCKVYWYVWYYVPHVCSWIVVLVTLERTISVCDPIRAKVICSVGRVQIAIASVVVGLALANVPVLFEWSVVTHANTSSCDVVPEWKPFYSQVWYWIDVGFLSVVPFTIILGCNVVMIYKLRKFGQARRFLSSSSDTDTMDSVIVSTAIMLVVVSIVFLITTLPSTVYYLLETKWLPELNYNGSVGEKLMRSKLFLTSVVCNLLYYLNNSINFLLYCLSGSYFRRTLHRICYRRFVCLRRKCLRRSTSSVKITLNTFETTALNMTTV